jgi:hypothetical protein
MGTSSRFRFIAVSTTLLITLFLFLQACNRGDDSPTPTPRAGGVVEASADAPQAAPAPTVAPTPTPVVFAVGDQLTAAQQVSFFSSAASSSTVLEVYAPGVGFTVMEPSEGFESYPVSSGGASWVRLRAPDGLAGWARADTLQP